MADLYLVGFRVDPDVTESELFTLFMYGEVDRPLTLDDRILFFSDPTLGGRALALAGWSDRSAGDPPTDVALTCDLAVALYEIAYGTADADSQLLTCLNTLLDMVAATELAMPAEHRRVLHALADHLTFSHDLAAFLDRGVARIDVQNAVLWSVGAIAVRARVIG